MSVLLLIILFLICTNSEEHGCTTNIFLESDTFRPQYAKWVNVSTKLRCPADVFEWSIWYSARAVYKMSTGCQLEKSNVLELDWFPDVPFITGVFRSYSTNVETICNFTSIEGMLKAELPRKTHVMNSDYSSQTTIYYAPNESLPINFYICKKAKFTNGSCLVHYTNGKSTGDDTALTNDVAYYKVTGSVTSEKIIKYECFATIQETVHLFTVISKPDTNECQEAQKRGLQLCQRSACIDQAPGYTCADGDYADLQTCSVTPGWFCPYTSTYDYMSLNDCDVKKCVQAANIGVQLCDTGVQDCEMSNNTYRCKRGVPLLDVCNSMNQAINMSCPQLSHDSPEIESDKKLGSTLYRLANNAKTLFDLHPEYLTNLSRELTTEQILSELDAHSDMERHQMAKQFINTLISSVHEPSEKTKNDGHGTPGIDSPSAPSWNQPGPPDSEPSKPRANIKPATTPKEKIHTATSILHIIASIVRKSPHTRTMIDSGLADRDGFKFMRLNKGKLAAKFNNSEGAPAGVMILSDSVAPDVDSVVAVIPGSDVKSAVAEEKIKPDEELPLDDQDFEVASDVILFDTLDPTLTYEWTSHMLTTWNNSYICQQLRPSKDNGKGTWSSEDCETVVVGKQLQCRCTPKSTGTFAIALVYWLGDPNIIIENKTLVETVSYVFTAITVIALLLFLIFTRFIGVFRLDQFNIAFSLLLFSIAVLLSPLLNKQHPIACTIVGIAICFFLLAAFAWKFIFGLNTLMLIVAPQSCYHDLISKHQNCIPLVWIAYLVPAVIIGAWFGYAGEVSSKLGCWGPLTARWILVGFITIVVIFNFFVLAIVGVILLRSYLLTRKSRVNKSTHFLVLTQLVLTLGLPYIIIYTQFVDTQAMLITVPIALGTTAVLMFLLVAVIDEENRHRLGSFIRAHFTRSTSVPGNQTTTPGQVKRRASAPSTDSQNNRKRLGLKQWSYREKIYGAKGNGEAAQNLKANKHVHSETTNSELKFEPGWLHRYPTTAKLPEEHSAVVSEDSLNTVAFNRMAQTTAPRTSVETYNSGPVTSPLTSETNLDDICFRPGSINSRGPLTFNSKNGVIGGRPTTQL